MNYHTSVIRNVAVSEDGKYIATAGYDKKIIIWDESTHQPVQQFIGHSDLIESVSFTRDSNRILSSSSDYTIRQWNIEDGELLVEYKFHEDDVMFCEMSLCGKYLVSGSLDRTVILWDSKGIPIKRYFEHEGSVNEVRFSPDGSKFASCGNDGRVIVYNTEGCSEKLYEIKLDTDLNSIAWKNESEILTAGDDGVCYVLNISEHRISSFVAHNAAIKRLSLRSNLLAIGSTDKTISLWNLDEIKSLGVIKVGRKWENGVVISADCRKIYTASFDGHFRCYSTLTLEEISTPIAPTSGINCTDIIGNKVIFGGDNNTVNIWDTSDGSVSKLIELESLIQDLSISPNKEIVAIGTYDGTVSLVKLNGESVLNFKDNERGMVNSITWIDNERFVSAGYNGAVFLHHTCGKVKELLKLNCAIKVVSFNPLKSTIAVGSNDGVVRVVTISGKIDYCSVADDNLVNSLCWSPDYKKIVSTGRSLNIYIHNVDNQNSKLFAAKGHRKSIKTIAWSKCGKRIFTGSYDETLKIWNISKNKVEKQILNFKSGISSITTISKSNDFVVSSWNGIIRKYNSNGQELACFSL